MPCLVCSQWFTGSTASQVNSFAINELEWIPTETGQQNPYETNSDMNPMSSENNRIAIASSCEPPDRFVHSFGKDLAAKTEFRFQIGGHTMACYVPIKAPSLGNQRLCLKSLAAANAHQ